MHTQRSAQRCQRESAPAACAGQGAGPGARTSNSAPQPSHCTCRACVPWPPVLSMARRLLWHEQVCEQPQMHSYEPGWLVQEG